MREGIHRCSNQRLRYGQEDDDGPIENFSLLSRPHNRRRASKFIILCLFLCIMTWTMSKTLQQMFPFSIERSEHQLATQGIMFELFRYHIHGQTNNGTFNAMHRRRRNQNVQQNKDISDLLNIDILESETHEICNDDDIETKPFNRKDYEVSPPNEYDQSLKKRIPRGSKTKDPEALGQWPLFGGNRETDMDIEALFVKVSIGYGTKLTEYFLHIDTGSGITWVMCKGRGPITAVGPNGLFTPRKGTFVDCRKQSKNYELCLKFQEGVKQPCLKTNDYKCLFDHEYGDGLYVRGHVVTGDMSLTKKDGSKSRVHISFGCADQVDDGNTAKDKDEHIQHTDGLIGLGPHPASWLQQLNDLGLIQDHLLSICIKPDVKEKTPQRIGPVLPTSVGFLSFGNSHASQDKKTIWTTNIPVENKDGDMEPMYIARLLAIKYGTQIIPLKEPEKRKKKKSDQSDVPGVKMGFDTASDLTYFTTTVYQDVVKLLNKEAKSKGYSKAKDSSEFVKEEQRVCWSNKQQIIPVTEFRDLVLMFASLNKDGTTSDMVIKPQYYITTGGSKRYGRTCLNILKEADFDFGNIGAEVMKGHIFFFDSNVNKIGWRAVQSCENLN